MTDHTPYIPSGTILSGDLPPIIPRPTSRTRDRTGQRFMRLIVLGYVGIGKSNKNMWLCRCDCGNHACVSTNSLISGNTKSCGCYNRDAILQRTTIHGLSDTPEYDTLSGMIRRCNNPDAPNYRLYGGRGITVCQRWQASVQAFIEDMGNRPSAAHSIDRIDSLGHYSCGHCEECQRNGWQANCRWATPREQANNISTNRLLEYNGQRMSMAQWARKMGIHYRTLKSRLNLNWSVERALTTPVRKR